MTEFNALSQRAHRIAVEHGFWGDAANYADAVYLGNKLMMVVREVSEAQEELRDHHPADEKYYRADGKPEGFGFEVADAIIRLMDLAEYLDLDMTALIEEKMDFNDTRAPLHGKAF